MSFYNKYKQQNAIIRIAIFTFLVKAIALSQYYLTEEAVGDAGLSFINALLYNFIFSGMIYGGLLLFWCLFTPIRELFNLSAFIYSLFTVLIFLTDLFIIRFTGMRFSPSIINTYGIDYIASPNVLHTLFDNSVLSLTMIMALLGVILMSVFYKKIINDKDCIKYQNVRVVIVTAIFLGSWVVVSNISSNYYFSTRPAEIAFLLPFSYKRKVAKEFNESEQIRINQLLEKYLGASIKNRDLPLMRTFKMDSSRNLEEYPDVFFIMIESLRGLELSFINGQDPSDTPALDSLSKAGVTFTKFMSNGYPSDDGMFPAHTSILPHYNRKNVRDNSGTRYSSLPKILQEVGYKTGALTAVKPFDSMLEWLEKWYEDVDFQCENGHCNDYEAFEKVQNWIRKQDSLLISKPLFYYVHTNDLHHPFYTRFSFATDMLGNKFYLSEQPEKEKKIRKRYKKTLESTDFALGKFLKYLAKRDKKDNTLIIFLGDHSKEAGDVFKSGTRLYPMNAMVLTGAVISGPEKYIGKPREVKFPTSSVDVLPTVVSSLNLEMNIATWGSNMLSSQRIGTSINVRPGGLRYNWGDSSLFINSSNPNDYWGTTFRDNTNDKTDFKSPALQQKAKEIYDLVQYNSFLIEENKLLE
jgi:phosphoglycerol transferase MdoB-like AlkP superfamily enzyme